MTDPQTGLPDANRFEDDPEEVLADLELPPGWQVAVAEQRDVEALTALLRRHEKRGRGWASSSEENVKVEVAGILTRTNLLVRDDTGTVRGWASAHDRAAGRMLTIVVVDRGLDEKVADCCADVLFEWCDAQARAVGDARGLPVQQIDATAFADDERQHQWLERHAYQRVRSWWQMSRAVTPDEQSLAPEPGRRGVVIRPVQREGSGMPDENDLRIVHDILEAAFADHFNSYEESFDEFVHRLREDPGHRWDHWWIAELVEEGQEPEPAGTLVATVSEGGVDDDGAPRPDGSYVAYIGVLQNARGRGVAKALLNTVIADAAERGRDRVGLEVDADSPTGAEGLYTSMGWQTKYVTESWHKDVPVDAQRSMP